MNNSTLIERYYRLHRDELLHFVSSRLGVGHNNSSFTAYDAEDLVQNVFLRLLQGERPISKDTLHSLVITMARNLVTDQYRRLYYQRTYNDYAQATTSAEYGIEPIIYAHDAIDHIENRLLHLPQSTAAIYRLNLYDGMKVSEISEQLQQDYKAVEYRLGQARREVRQLLHSSC